MEQQLSTYQWLQLPEHIRSQLVDIFKIPKSEGAFIQDNKVVSDGHTQRDLKAISIDSMQVFLASSETEFFKLFEAILAELNKKPTNKNDYVDQFHERRLLSMWRKELDLLRQNSIDEKLEHELLDLIKTTFNLSLYEQKTTETPSTEETNQRRKAGRPKKKGYSFE